MKTSIIFFLVLAVSGLCRGFEADQFNFGAATLGAGNTMSGDPAISEYYPTELSCIKHPFYTVSFKWAEGEIWHMYDSRADSLPAGKYRSEFLVTTSVGAGTPIDIWTFDRIGVFYSLPEIINYKDPAGGKFANQYANTVSVILNLKGATENVKYATKASYKWSGLGDRFLDPERNFTGWCLTLHVEFGSLLKPKSNMGAGFDFGAGPVKMGSAGIRFYPTTKGKDYTMLFGYGIAMNLAPGFYGFEYIYRDYPAFRAGTATNKMQEFSDKPTLFIYTLGTGFSFNRYFTWDMTFIRCLSIFNGQSAQRNSMVNTFVYQVVP